MTISNEFFDKFLENVAQMLGPTAEIVIHDFTHGLEHTVVRIINSQTGRKIGDAPSNLFFDKLQNEKGLPDLPPYFTEMDDGRIFKSITTYFRDETGKVTGAVCINMDVSGMTAAIQTLTDYLGRTDKETTPEVYTETLDDLMDHYLKESERLIGKPALKMNKQEKLEALDFLQQKGVLHMAKASVRLCEFFDFSKFTLYNYLDQLKKNGD